MLGPQSVSGFKVAHVFVRHTVPPPVKTMSVWSSPTLLADATQSVMHFDTWHVLSSPEARVPPWSNEQIVYPPLSEQLLGPLDLS
mmetsp:Transcript_11250/g.34663  ORF Transcript_11250/g.34663 Transcript_11250/m.34663 type:complete len:85 (-) Transcript_11250:341-595(-)